MDRSSKKHDERLVLDLIYSGRPGLVVEDGETPDFVLRTTGDVEPFGVEVTVLYASEFQARLDRVPGYVAHLLDGGPPKHRDDKKGIGTITLTQANGELVEADVPAICEPVLALAEYSRLLCERITSKDRTLDRKVVPLRHLNLVLADHTRRLSDVQPDQFFRMCCPQFVSEAVLNSRFREVYLIAEFATGPAIVPLRLLVSICRFLVVKAACLEHGAEKQAVPDILEVFADDLARLSRVGVWRREDENGVEILFGDSGLLLDTNGGTIVRLYRDQQFPQADRVRSPENSVCPAGIQEMIESLSRASAVSVAIAFPVPPEQWKKALGSAA